MIISTAVYDHLLLKEDEIIERKELFQNVYYYVSSEKLKNIYDSIELYKNPLMVIEDGVDPDLFYPINIKRFTIKKKILRIGWTGNSTWDLDYDIKGFKTFIVPSVKQLKKSKYRVKGVYQERKHRMIAHNKMVKFYSKIDLLICMSLTEGTPNPVLEAMACGVPIISTDVGIVPQVLGEKQKEFILKERNIESLKEAILELYQNRDLLYELSQENLKLIENWYWSKQCEKFRAYFKELINYKLDD